MVDVFPRTNGLRRTERKADKFRWKRLDLFPRTSRGADIKMDVSNHVETVVLLSDKKIDGHINIDLDVEKLEDKSVASKRGKVSFRTTDATRRAIEL